MLRHADIALLNSCNYNCDYCKSGSTQTRCNNADAKMFDISSPVIDYEALIAFTRDQLGGWIIQLSGGEPLTLPGIEYLVRELTKTNKVIICTNGSMLPHRTKLLELQHERVFFRVSVHPEQRKVTNLLKDIDGVLQSGHRILLNYMVHPRHITSSMYGETRACLEESGLPFELTPFEGTYEGKTYRLFDRAYWGYCDQMLIAVEPLQMITIRPNGLVFRCHGEANTPIGDVYKGSVDLANGCLMNCTMPNKASVCPVYDPIMRIMELWS